jgi:hypothetical protein
MTPMDPDTLTKADRLAIGGAVAPAVRRQAATPRKVTLVGKDGKPTGQTTSVEVAKSLLARAEIEFSVQEGERPEWVKCRRCEQPVKVRPYGSLPVQCPTGTYACPCGAPIKSYGCGFGKRCQDCNRRDPQRTVDTAKISAAIKAYYASLSPEERSERARRASMSRTPEQRQKIARYGAALAKEATTPEQRTENARKASRARSPEAIARSAKAGADLFAALNKERSREDQSRMAREACARMTPEQRSERSRKANATRAARRREQEPAKPT